ncbi:MAG: bacterial transcriptional activator domain-containing protein, partial [Anaerolineae bacterium]
HAVGPQAAALLLGSDASSRLALGFNHSICQVDAQAFLRLAHYADASPDPDGLRAAEQAAQIGNAPLLVGLELNGTPEFEHWLREQREHFDRLRVDVLRRMAQGYAALRDYPRAMAAVQQALTLDQWSVRNDFSAALTYG